MRHINSMECEVRTNIKSKLDSMGINVPEELISKILFRAFGFGMCYKKDVLASILKCDENGVMGPITITPKIPQSLNHRWMISEWLRMNGINISFKAGNALNDHFKHGWRWSILEEYGDPTILLPDLPLVVVIMHMAIYAMAEIGKELGISRVALLSIGGPTAYEHAWVIVDLHDDRIRVEI